MENVYEITHENKIIIKWFIIMRYTKFKRVGLGIAQEKFSVIYLLNINIYIYII